MRCVRRRFALAARRHRIARKLGGAERPTFVCADGGASGARPRFVRANRARMALRARRKADGGGRCDGAGSAAIRRHRWDNAAKFGWSACRSHSGATARAGSSGGRSSRCAAPYRRPGRASTAGSGRPCRRSAGRAPSHSARASSGYGRATGARRRKRPGGSSHRRALYRYGRRRYRYG